ncbi:MAG: hypothetical protein QNJ41_00940 [Xenococcaceae cyanobacterium MO_188.B32]|nr:hypothetical protein [Xenococcaceae cyanobacterium MO_188.B32]
MTLELGELYILSGDINPADYPNIQSILGKETNSLESTGLAAIGVDTITSGQAGNIKINTQNIVVSGNNARILSNTSGDGNAGGIDITTTELYVNSGNITLDIADNLTLREESTISAEATGDANGGNIDIDAEFIIAPPNQNSNIIARASEGRGGNITITAEGVFGLEQRSSTPPNETNDIDASSQFNLDGNVVINTPDLSKFEESLEQLEIVQLETLGANACARGGGQTGATSFNITGRGGVPPLLTDPLSSDSIYVEGESVNSRKEETSNKFDDDRKETDKKEDKEENVVVLVERTEPISIDDIIPARGAIVLENGDVILTPYPTSNNQRIPDNSNNCGKS